MGGVGGGDGASHLMCKRLVVTPLIAYPVSACIAFVKIAALKMASTSATVVGGTMRTEPLNTGEMYWAVTKSKSKPPENCCIIAFFNPSACGEICSCSTTSPMTMLKLTPSLYCTPLGSGASGAGIDGGDGGLSERILAGL